MHKNKKNINWFTLVEFLVVMTLVAILATISYIYVVNNIAESNDAKRSTDLSQIATAMDVYFTKQSVYPEPDDWVAMTYSGTHLAWTQWTFWIEASKALKTYWAEYPRDEKFDTNYAYSTTNRSREYQLAAIRQVTEEDDEDLWEISLGKIVPSTHAASVATAIVVGNYNGFMVRAELDWSNQVYFVATPSILSFDIADTDVESVITNQKLVFDDFFNLPHVYEWQKKLDWWFNFNVTDPLLYSGTTEDLKQESVLLDFNDSLKFTYSTTPTESFDTYLNILEEDSLTKLKKFITKTFKVQFRSYFNCKDILDDFASEWDGMYTISPNADGTGSYQVYCDMTTEWWGWTRVGDNHLENWDFVGGQWVTGAIENEDDTHEVVAVNGPEWLTHALHQIWNYSSNYQMEFDEAELLKSGYELRMTAWRSDNGTWASPSDTNDVVIMWGKSNPWTVWSCTNNSYSPWCQMVWFNRKLANPSNYGPGWALTEIIFSVKEPTQTVTTDYLDWDILFDWFTPSIDSDRANNWTDAYGTSEYSPEEIEAIDQWVLAWGFLISTNDEQDYDPLGEYYKRPTEEYNYYWNVVDDDETGTSWNERWTILNVDHPIVNWEIWLQTSLIGRELTWRYRHSWLAGPLDPEDIILADFTQNWKPTVILRKHWKGHILITSWDWIFKDMDTTNTFDAWDPETVLAANIMTYAIETAAWIVPHEGYAFHNRIYYDDWTFSTNWKDEILATETVDGKVWTKERTRHKIFKTPTSFNWYLWLDANNNKDLYFTGLRLELFYR